jgi:hypothetical protein
MMHFKQSAIAEMMPVRQLPMQEKIPVMQEKMIPISGVRIFGLWDAIAALMNQRLEPLRPRATRSEITDI